MGDGGGVMREEKSLVVVVIGLSDGVDGEGGQQGQDLKRRLRIEVWLGRDKDPLDGGEEEGEVRVSAGVTGEREGMGLVEELGGLSEGLPVGCRDRLSHQLAVACPGRVCLC